MLRIKEIIADGVKKFALLRLQENGSYAELGLYARNSYAVSKAKAIMSQTKEVLECKFNGVLDVWKLQNDELISTEADQLQAIERMKALLQTTEQERNFREKNEPVILSFDISTVQTNPIEQNDLNAVLSALSQSLYVIKKPNQFMDFINGAKHIDVVHDEVWGYEPENWAKGCSADKRNALRACAVAGQPQAPP